MPIRGRVGRHTQQGGRHCQNWNDDQKTIIDLLNRISPINGGTGGSLNPRVVAGIASNELYAAIVAFENKHFSGRCSGYIDPGGKMYLMLETLAHPSPASVPVLPPTPVPPPVPVTPPAAVLPHRRSITNDERALLRSVFEETLPYGGLEVASNTGNLGGANNSIT